MNWTIEYTNQDNVRWCAVPGGRLYQVGDYGADGFFRWSPPVFVPDVPTGVEYA